MRCYTSNGVFIPCCYGGAERGKAGCTCYDGKRSVQNEKSGDFPLIAIYQQDWIPGFAAFMNNGSIKKKAEAHVVLNLAAFIAAVCEGDVPKAELPYFIAESIMHEVMHVIEAWVGVDFNEERIDELIAAYNAKYGPK